MGLIRCQFYFKSYNKILPAIQVVPAIKIVLNFDNLGLRGLMIALYLQKNIMKKSNEKEILLLVQYWLRIFYQIFTLSKFSEIQSTKIFCFQN